MVTIGRTECKQILRDMAKQIGDINRGNHAWAGAMMKVITVLIALRKDCVGMVIAALCVLVRCPYHSVIDGKVDHGRKEHTAMVEKVRTWLNDAGIVWHGHSPLVAVLISPEVHRAKVSEALVALGLPGAAYLLSRDRALRSLTDRSTLVEMIREVRAADSRYDTSGLDRVVEFFKPIADHDAGILTNSADTVRTLAMMTGPRLTSIIPEKVLMRTSSDIRRAASEGLSKFI